MAQPGTAGNDVGPTGQDVIPSGHEIAQLPVRALSNPRETLVLADAVLARSHDPTERSFAGQARGIALRETGNVRAAVRQLTRAHHDAEAAGPSRQADVAATLAVTLALAGRGREGVERMASALQLVRGAEAARIQVRMGSMLGELGMFPEADRELRAAATRLRRAGDGIWEARAQLNLAMAGVELGDTRRAEAALARADKLLGNTGNPYELGVTSEFRGLVAVLDGRTPAALRHYDDARRWYADAGTHAWEVACSQSAALLAVGLGRDALASAQQALDMLSGPNASPVHRAKALLHACDAALSDGQHPLGQQLAAEARGLYRKVRIERLELLARVRLARACWLAGERTPALSQEAAEVANEAGRLRMPEAVEANLLAGELALHHDDHAAAGRHLTRARRARTGRSDLARVLGWRAAALSAQDAGRPQAVLTACDRGLSVLESYLGTLGAIETRATATAHGFPLATLGVATAVRTGDPVRMLHWVERWRSTTLRLPTVRPPDDPDLAVDLAQLRLARLRLGDPAAAERRDGVLDREVTRLESAVRDRTHRVPGSGPVERVDVEAALAAATDVTLVEIFLSEGTVHVLVADAAGVRHHVAGEHAEALKAVDFARFTLRRMTHRTHASRAQAALPARAQALQDLTLGSAAADLGDGPVVVVPPASLTSAPWGILPALQHRAVHVAASVGSWWSARSSVRPVGGRVALVAGPELAQAELEIDGLAALYPAAQVLRGGTADADGVLAAIDGADLAHVAAHGTFRADNPLFSALHLADGPLTVYDLQRLERAPRRLVLSCCDSGTVSPAGADEALGIASALVPLGMAGMIAAAVPVSDAAAVPFALALHERLRAGATTAEALRDARVTADQPASVAIAHSFAAFGAG